MRISDWSSDVCSSDLPTDPRGARYDYTLRSRIDDLGALLRHAGIDEETPVTLAVHDWGGMIGFGWALSHMPQVKRLVVLNTAAFPLPTATPMPWQRSDERRVGREWVSTCRMWGRTYN